MGQIFVENGPIYINDPEWVAYNLSHGWVRTRIFADWADGSRLDFGRVIISNFNWRGFYRDVAPTALGLWWDWVVLSRCRADGAWIVVGLWGFIEMSLWRRLDCGVIVWFYRDVAPTALGLGWICVVLWRCRFSLRPRMGRIWFITWVS